MPLSPVKDDPHVQGDKCPIDTLNSENPDSPVEVGLKRPRSSRHDVSVMAGLKELQLSSCDQNVELNLFTGEPDVPAMSSMGPDLAAGPEPEPSEDPDGGGGPTLKELLARRRKKTPQEKEAKREYLALLAKWKGTCFSLGQVSSFSVVCLQLVFILFCA
ncbi:uncharacterized protein LOC126800110 [Argentina anserina]|uniref:uncharacterized protein LOC126800110 n=1 Tax=Argentina anserina TaxID=57926 RepID=UPI002176354E|nr:uncharacterized protein LOC126800110 [Potentilla anserina]